MGMNKVLVCNRNGYGIELFCFFSISNSIHNRIEIFDSIVNSNPSTEDFGLFDDVAGWENGSKIENVCGLV